MRTTGLAGVSENERLDSWKEIARYLRRGVRTVQRWEREEGLPVHRLPHEKLGSVYAWPAELDAWFGRRGKSPEPRTKQDETDAGPSVAVLPFADMSADGDQRSFCDGIAEEIRHALGRIEGLRTAPRSSTVTEGVRTRLEGSVRKSGERVRIAVELIDVESGFPVWAQRYERTLRDAFEIQDEIAERVANALRVTLVRQDRSVRAEDCCRRGREYYYEYSAKATEFAIRMFLEAIKLEPGCAAAYAGLADCWSYTYLYSDPSQAVREQAEWASGRALELEPHAAEALASRGLWLSLSGRVDEADAAFAAARPNERVFEAHYFRARHCFALGRFREAADAYEAAMRAQPDDFQAPLEAAAIYDELGLPVEAAAARERGIAAAERHLRLKPDAPRALYLAAGAFAAMSKRERALQWAERARTIGGEEPVLLFNLGCIYALLGMTEQGLDCLDGAARGGFTHRAWYERDRSLEGLRPHPRFRELMEGLGRGAALTSGCCPG